MRHTKRGGWPYSQPPNVQFEINRASPQAKGLVAWWPTLAARGGNQVPDLVGGNTGTLSGAVWQNDPFYGFVFDDGGANGHLQLARRITLNTATRWSLASRQRFDDTQTAGFEPVMGSADGQEGPFYSCAHGKWYFSDGVSFPSVIYSLWTRSGEWQHVVWTCDGTAANNLRLYLNGVYRGVCTLNAVNVDLDYIGRYAFVYRDGAFSDTRIINRMLTSAEVCQLDAEPWELYKPLIRRFSGWRSPAPPPVGGHMTLWGRYWGP